VHLEEEWLKEEAACQVAEEQRITGEEAVASLPEDNDTLLSEAFDLKLREIKLQFGLGVMEDRMDNTMVVSQGENRAESGKVGGLQGEGEKGWPKPRPLTKVRAITIDSIGSDKDDKDDDSMESEIVEVRPRPSKAGSKSSGGLKHKRLLGEVEVKTEQVRGHKVCC